MSLQSVFDVVSLKRTELIGKAKSVIAAFAKSSATEDEKDDLPADSDESQPLDWWQHYGFISRPPQDSETLIARVGANVFALASRTLAAAKAFGKLGEGDVALYSLAGALFKLAATGAVTLLVPAPGNKQTVIHVSPIDGSIKALVPPGLAFEMSPKNGVLINAGSGDITFAGGKIQMIGDSCNINCGCLKLGVAPLGPVLTGMTGIDGKPSLSVQA